MEHSGRLFLAIILPGPVLNLNCSVCAIEYGPSRLQRDPCLGRLGARPTPLSNPQPIYDDVQIVTVRLKLRSNFWATHGKLSLRAA